MGAQTRHSTPGSLSPIAAAALGALAGAAGVWALDRLDWFLWNRVPEEDQERTKAARPGGKSPTTVMVGKLSGATGVELSEDAQSAASTGIHYALGIGPAIGYALLRDRLPGSGAVRGALYGAALFALQDEGVNTATGLAGKPGDYPWQDHARGAAAHMLYGVVTDLALTAMERGLGRARAS